MRGKALKTWFALVVLLAAEVLTYIAAGYLAAYRSRAFYEWFNQAGAVRREVSGLPYADLINQNAVRYEVNPELAAAVIRAESSFEPRALSPAGAYGLMQVIPGTWRLVNNQIKACAGRHSGECASECFYTPELNIQIGTAYLGQLAKRYNGCMTFAVAAYNAGPGAVDQYGGIPPYAETIHYVERVAGYWYQISGCPLPVGGVSAAQLLEIRTGAGWAMKFTAVGIAGWMLYLRRKYGSWRWR